MLLIDINMYPLISFFGLFILIVIAWLFSSSKKTINWRVILCGFAHFASMAIFIGGISALVPERISLLLRIGIKCLLAATFACLMTACMGRWEDGKTS